MSARENILKALQNSNGEFISGAQLAKKLGISRNAVWKNIKSLEENGYKIKAVTNKGYKLYGECSLMNSDEIKKNLKTKSIGCEITVFNEIDSTNNYAKEIAKTKNVPHGYTIISESQSTGKGRMGRTFLSPANTGIYMSVILRPKFNIEYAQLLTSCTATAVCDAIDRLCKTNTQIKWVNDIFLNGKKICGILTEASIGFESGQLEFAVVGIGINVKSIKNKLPTEILDVATSIEDECHKEIDRNIIAAEILNSLENYLQNIETKNFLDIYREKSFIIGKNVMVTVKNQEKKATAIAIDDNAGLIVKFEDETTQTLNSGEARIIPI